MQPGGTAVISGKPTPPLLNHVHCQLSARAKLFISPKAHFSGTQPQLHFHFLARGAKHSAKKLRVATFDALTAERGEECVTN